MAKKSKLARCSGAGAGEDRLSSLPQEILINNILSLLPIRDAQRTSILARSWRDLWSYVPRLDLDLDGSHKLVPIPLTSFGKRQVQVQVFDMDLATKYAEWVDRVVGAYRGTTALRHFRVSFRLGYQLTSKIDSWLEFSLRQGVEVLELGCCDTYSNGDYVPYTFPLSIEPSRFPNIRLLKSLTLRGLRISSDFLEGLLSVCEFLETLHLSLMFNLTHVNVTGPVSRLKHIHIDSSCFVLMSIGILSPTPDLVSFTYPWRVEDRVQIEHAPQLVDLKMVLVSKFPSDCQRHITLHPLFRYISQLEALDLVLSVQELERNLGRVYDFPVLGRLKHLEWTQMDCAVKGLEAHWVASLIQKAPLLQQLTLGVRFRGVMSRAKPASLREELDKMHLQLPPVIEIRGFRGRQADCEDVLHLIKDSPTLEKLIIDCRDPYLLLKGCTFAAYECSEKTVKKWKRIIKEVIEPQLPSKAKLVVI